MNILKNTIIQAPPELIFQCVVDAELIPRWMDNVESIRYTSEIDPLQPVGTTFSQRVREGLFTRVYDGEVVTYEEYNRFAVRFGDKRFRFQLDYHIEAQGPETHVSYRLQSVRESTFMALAGRMVRSMAEGMARSHIHSLKQFAESRR